MKQTIKHSTSSPGSPPLFSRGWAGGEVKQYMILRSHLFFILLSFIFIHPLSAQQTGVLRGKVMDGSSKELLPGATILLISTVTKGTSTDLDGNYSMVLDTGYHQLYCTYVGYVNDTFAIQINESSITEKNIAFQPVAKFLETIVVSSGKFEQKLEELTVSMEVIKPQMINQSRSGLFAWR